MQAKIDEEIARIVRQIIRKYKPERIILFGSAARGEWNLDSDADFLVIKSQVPTRGADRIRELSRLIKRDIPMDLLVYKPEEFSDRLEKGDPFIRTILTEGKLLYG